VKLFFTAFASTFDMSIALFLGTFTLGFPVAADAREACVRTSVGDVVCGELISNPSSTSVACNTIILRGSTLNWITLRNGSRFNQGTVTVNSVNSVTQLSIYPNPVENELTIESVLLNNTDSQTEGWKKDKSNSANTPSKNSLSAKVYDIFGRFVLSGVGKNGKLVMNLNSLKSGVYVLHVADGDQSIQKQIVVQK